MGRRTSALCLCTLWMAALGQAERKDAKFGFGIGFSNGITIRCGTVVEPAAKAESYQIGGGVNVGAGNRAHRYTYNSQSKIFFGYDVTVEPIPGTRQIRVTFSPFSLAVDQLGSPAASLVGYRPIALPKYPAPQVVNEGDTIALDLWESADQSAKVVDYLLISRTPLSVDSEVDLSKARDYTLDNVPLRITSPQVRIDGALLELQPRFLDVSGPVAWMYLPGRGRFLFTIVPHQEQGFMKAGTVHDNMISFRAGQSRYDLQLTQPVLPTAGLWNLYVLHDRDYSGGREPNEAQFGAADRIEAIIKP